MAQRCPACGATNPDSAKWCGQCYERFDAAPAAAGHAPADRPPTAAREGDVETPSGFRKRGDLIEWACPQCEHYNAIELSQCEICGTAFVERFRPHEPDVDHDWRKALVLSALAPGLGHVSVGRSGAGTARLVLVALCLLGVIALLASGGSRALVVAAPLLLGVIAVWVGSVVDIARLQRNQPQLLAGRRLLWLVVGVLALLVVSLLASAMTLSPSG